MDNYFSRYVQLALSGDDSAYETLYSLTKDQAYYAILSITKNKDEARDIMQDSYISAFDNLSMLEAPEYFGLWLNKIVLSSLKDYIQAKNPGLFNYEQGCDISDWDEKDNRENLIQENADDKDTQRHVAEIISSLPDDQKLLVIMYYYQDMEISDIADSIEMSEDYVKYCLKKAGHSINNLLRKLMDEGALIQPVTTAAIPSVLSAEAKSQLLLNPAPQFSDLIFIYPEGSEDQPAAGQQTPADQQQVQDFKTDSGENTPLPAEPDNQTSRPFAGNTYDQAQSQQTAVSYNDQTFEGKPTGGSFPQESAGRTQAPYGGSDNQVNAAYKAAQSQSNGYESAAHKNWQGVSYHRNRVSDEFSRYNPPAPAGGGSTVKVSSGKLSGFMSTTAGKFTVVAAAVAVVAIGIFVLISVMAKNDSITVSGDLPYSEAAPVSSEDISESKEPTEEEIMRAELDNYEYKKNINGTVTITKYKGYLENVVLPDKLGGKKVTTIGYNAFENASHIKSITLSKYIKTVITADTIKSSPFSECIYLENINVVPGNANFSSEDGILYDKNKSELIVYPSGRKDSSFDIPNTVKSIHYRAFAENRMLEEINMPPSISLISKRAFYNCSSLKSIKIPDGVARINEGTFEGCSSLEDVNLPESLEYIEISAFKRCISLRNIEMPKKLLAIKTDAFMQCSALDTVTIPNPNTALDETDKDNIQNNTGTFYMSPVIIKAPEGSKAEHYAKICNIPFEAL